MYLFLRQLVVRRAGDHRALEAGQGVVVHRGTQGAGGIDVHVQVVHLVRPHDGDRMKRGDGGQPILVDVGEEHLCTLLHQVADQRGAHVACSLHAHLAAVQAVGTEGLLRGRLHATVHAIGGHGAGIAAAAHFLGQTGHMHRLLADVHHLGCAHAHVLGGDVAAVQAVHETPETAEHGLGLVGAAVADDHRLAPAQVQPGERALVGHAAAQPQHIVQCVAFGGVGPHAGAPQGGAQGGVVHRDDGAQAGGAVEAEEHLLVVMLLHASQHSCGADGLCRCQFHGAGRWWSSTGEGTHRTRRAGRITRKHSVKARGIPRCRPAYLWGPGRASCRKAGQK